MTNKEVNKISIHYVNGEVVDKYKGFCGYISNIDETTGQYTVVFECCNMSGEEFLKVTDAIEIGLGDD